ALLLTEAAQMKAADEGVIGVVFSPQQAVCRELIQIICVNCVGTFPIENDQRVANEADRIKGSTEGVFIADEGNLSMAELNPIDGFPMKIGGVRVAGLVEEITRTG